jgi:hypothetical protein
LYILFEIFVIVLCTGERTVRIVPLCDHLLFGGINQALGSVEEIDG